MMTLHEFVRRIDGFDLLSNTDKIRHFAWYLNTQRKLPKFRTSDMTATFDEVGLHRPKNTSQLLSSLLGRDLIGEGDGFKLAKGLRDNLDAKYQDRQETVSVHSLLSELPSKLPDLAQQDYLREALLCFRSQAFRAAVVMTWNVAYDHLLTVLVTKHLTVFNSQLAGMFGGKRKPVSNREDFQRWKESEVVEVANAAGVISKEVAKVLTEKLGGRNSAAHPSGSRVDKLQAEAFISDLINNALLKIT